MKKGFFRRRTSFIIVTAVALLSVAGLVTYQLGTSHANPATPDRSFSPAGTFFYPGPNPPLDGACLKTKTPPQGTQSPVPCVSPHELQADYNIDPLLDAGNTGKGQTIVIFDPIGSPTIQQDLKAYDKGYNIPDPPSFQVLAPFGTAKFDLNNADDQAFAFETSIDVEFAHAMAPAANIDLVTTTVAETVGRQGFPELYKAEKYAFDNKLGNIWLQCWGTGETTLQDSTQAKDPNTGQTIFAEFEDLYKQAAGQRISVFAAAGDTGTGNPGIDGKVVNKPTGNFPATSPLVTAVGGTSMTIDGHGNRQGETVWNNVATGSGKATAGAVSAQFQEPAYQTALLPESDQKLLNGKRGGNDIASNANSLSAAMLTYASFLSSNTVAGQSEVGWFVNGGTSSAAPLWAGIIADANQEAGHCLGFLNPDFYLLGNLSQGTKTTNSKMAPILEELGKKINAKDAYHDITVGNNSGVGGVQGFNATPGWDIPTGWGSPDAAKLVAALLEADEQVGSQDPSTFV